jgi:hypothetical protein
VGRAVGNEDEEVTVAMGAGWALMLAAEEAREEECEEECDEVELDL